MHSENRAPLGASLWPYSQSLLALPLLLMHRMKNTRRDRSMHRIGRKRAMPTNERTTRPCAKLCYSCIKTFRAGAPFLRNLPVSKPDWETMRPPSTGCGGPQIWVCLLYTSDAADERSSVDLGG